MQPHQGIPVLPGDDNSQDGGPSQSRDPEAMTQARVDIRKLQQFLTGQQVNPSKAMCSKNHPILLIKLKNVKRQHKEQIGRLFSDIVHETVVHLILLHEDVSLQYFIPAVA